MSLEIGDLASGIVLVKDTLDADASFILVYALKLILAADRQHNAIVVLARNTATHLAGVLRKHGINMLSLVDGGRLVVIDTLRQIRPSTKGSSADGSEPLKYLTVGSLYKNIIKGAASLQGPILPVNIMFDDINALGLAMESGSDANAYRLVTLLRGCIALDTTLERPISCLAIAHQDIDDDVQCIDRLEHAATTVIDVQPLESGTSNEISGKVLIHRRDFSADDISLGHSQLYYKLSESGAKFFQHVTALSV